MNLSQLDQDKRSYREVWRAMSELVRFSKLGHYSEGELRLMQESIAAHRQVLDSLRERIGPVGFVPGKTKL
jgi:hypothetical protein